MNLNWTPHPLERSRLALSQMAKSDPEALRLLTLSAVYTFAGIRLPDSRLGTNSIYFGQIGGGKTLELRMFMRHVLGPIVFGGQRMLRHRAVVFDHKGNDVLPDLHAWCPEELLAVVNPYCPHGVALHLGKSCATFEDCEQLSYVLIPDDGHEFFNPASRDAVRPVIEVFHDKGHEWTLADIVVACSDQRLLKHVLAHHPRGKEIIADLLPNIDTSKNIIQTLRTKLAPWRTAALLERKSKHYITVDGWLNSGGVIVLQGSARNPDTIKRYNSFLFKLLVSRLRAREENYPLDESFLFVDEMPESILDDYRDALLLGRVKGVRTAATIQDPAGLINRFGSKEKASEVLGQIGNVCVGRITSPDSAKWIGEFFGKNESWIGRPGHSWDHQGRRSESVSYDIREEHNVYPFDLQAFPSASLKRGYEVVARTPSINGWRLHVTPQFIHENLGDGPPPVEPRGRRQLERSDIEYTWTELDMHRLQLRQLSKSRSDRRKRRGGLDLP